MDSVLDELVKNSASCIEEMEKKEEWKKMTLKGERPTPEEVINYAVKKLKGK